jgi:hypothetical protein
MLQKKQKLTVEEFKKLSDEEKFKRLQEAEEAQDERPIGEPFLNRSGGVSIRLLPKQEGLPPGYTGWPCWIHLHLHRGMVKPLADIWEKLGTFVVENEDKIPVHVPKPRQKRGK